MLLKLSNSSHIYMREDYMKEFKLLLFGAINCYLSGIFFILHKHENGDPIVFNSQVSVPQDMCTPIMMNTNGTLFHLDVTRKSLSAWTGRVAEGAVPSVPWQQCERVMGRDNVPTWHCHRASPNTKLKVRPVVGSPFSFLSRIFLSINIK